MGKLIKGSSWWWHWIVKTVLLKKLEEEIKKMHVCYSVSRSSQSILEYFLLITV